MKMKRAISMLSLLLCILFLNACTKGAGNAPKQGEESETQERIPTQQTEKEDQSVRTERLDLNMIIGNEVFPVKLYENQTTQALVDLMPMTIDMSELNGNEKLYYLPDKLPTDTEQPGQIRAGDIMLYGDDCLVVFYETFSSSYRYTRLGYVEDVAVLAQAVGDGTIRVTFELTKAE